MKSRIGQSFAGDPGQCTSAFKVELFLTSNVDCATEQRELVAQPGDGREKRRKEKSMMVGSTGQHELCWTRQLFLGGLLATGVFKRTAKTNALWRYWKRRIEVDVGVGIWRGEFLFTDPLPSIVSGVARIEAQKRKGGVADEARHGNNKLILKT